MIHMDGPRAFMNRLERFDPLAVKSGGLEAAAPRSHHTVTELLSYAPGAAPDLAALGAGELHASIAHVVTGDEVVIFFTSDVAAAQELSTVRTRPRPFSAPIAAQHTDAAARSIATVLRDDIHGDSP